MKQLLTLCLALMGVTAMAQVPTLPYNSDWNNNGIIETVDLMQLLSDFGELFSSAVVSEDEESAIVYMGTMRHSQCQYTCEQLPGIWRLPKVGDLHPVWSEVQNAFTWLTPEDYSGGPFPYYRGNESTVFYEDNLSGLRCYCASKQMPRVEYDICTAYSGLGIENTLQELKIGCVNPKLAEGWMLKGDVNCNDSNRCFQTLWRWAE